VPGLNELKRSPAISRSVPVVLWCYFYSTVKHVISIRLEWSYECDKIYLDVENIARTGKNMLLKYIGVEYGLDTQDWTTENVSFFKSLYI